MLISGRKYLHQFFPFTDCLKHIIILQQALRISFNQTRYIRQKIFPTRMFNGLVPWVSNIFVSRSCSVDIFSFILQMLWKVLVIFHVMRICQSAPCRRTLRTPRQVVEEVSEQRWMLVKPSSPVRKKRFAFRPAQIRKSYYCNWTTEIEYNDDRFPKRLVQAVCKGCSWHCRPVDYELKVLMRDCSNDMRTHRHEIKVWKWESISQTVAFVYNPV